MPNNVCPLCTGWLLERDGWLRCSCGYAEKPNKRIIKPVGGLHMDVDDTFNSEPGGCPAGPGTTSGSDPYDYKNKPKKSKPKLPTT